MAMKIDESLQHIGEFGRYQQWIYFLLSLPSISIGSFCMIVIVVLYTPEHRCKIPGYANDTYEVQSAFHEQLINLTIPPTSDPLIKYDRCKVYNVDVDTAATLRRLPNASMVKCQEWVYDKSVFYDTFTTKINLVCDDALKTSHIQMMFYFGLLVGDFVLGMLADIIGRKKSLIIGLFFLLITSVAVTWAPEFFSFAILEFLVGGFAHGAFLCIAVISMEMVGPSKRVLTGMPIQGFFAMGGCYLALVGYIARSYQWISLGCALPCVLYLAYWWLIPESPRWLLSNDRRDESIQIMRKTARINKAKDVGEHVFDLTADTSGPQGKLWHVFARPVLLKRTLILSFNWMIVSMTYYGVTMNSGNLGGDFFLNFFLMAVAEIPGTILGMMVLNKLGRRWSNSGSMIIGGLACLATVPTVLLGSSDLQPLTIAFAFIGKAGASAAFGCVYMFTAELLPTVVRNAAMGSCSCAARLGSMIAPYIAKSGEMIGGKFGMVEPLMVFGILSIIAGALLLLLPETLNQKLPDTIEEGVEFGRALWSRGNVPDYGSKSRGCEPRRGQEFITIFRGPEFGSNQETERLVEKYQEERRA